MTIDRHGHDWVVGKCLRCGMYQGGSFADLTCVVAKDYARDDAATNFDRVGTLVECASRLLDMVKRVEWVRASAGRKHVCPFCHAVSDRDGGPGHLDDCEWLQVTHTGNELRVAGWLR